MFILNVEEKSATKSPQAMAPVVLHSDSSILQESEAKEKAGKVEGVEISESTFPALHASSESLTPDTKKKGDSKEAADPTASSVCLAMQEKEKQKERKQTEEGEAKKAEEKSQRTKVITSMVGLLAPFCASIISLSKIGIFISPLFSSLLLQQFLPSMEAKTKRLVMMARRKVCPPQKGQV